MNTHAIHTSIGQRPILAGITGLCFSLTLACSSSSRSGTTPAVDGGGNDTGTDGAARADSGKLGGMDAGMGSDADSGGDGSDTGGPLPSPVLTCGAVGPSSLTPDSSTDAIEADLLTGDQNDRVVANGTPFQITFTTRVTAADTVSWQLADQESVVRASGKFSVSSGTTVNQIQCQSTRAGYFAITAQLLTAGDALQVRGSRPQGIATFGVLPALDSVLGAAVYPHLDDHRFGIEGTNLFNNSVWFQPAYADLGVVWAYDSRDWSTLEPTMSGQYDPTTYPAMTGLYFVSPAQYAHDGLLRYITVDGIPAWASSAAKAGDSYPPTSFSAYGTFLGKVAQEQLADLTNVPTQEHNYYQVTWEPDPGTGNQWLGTASEFVELYQTAYQAIHAADPHAVVLGPSELSSGYGCGMNFTSQPISLYNPAYAGLAKYLDGFTLHAYYGGDDPANPPEGSPFISDLRVVRHAVATQLPAHAKVISSESGTSYNANYSPTYPSAQDLAEHADIVVRSHLILVGEGVDVTFFYYSADYSGQPGYGLYFNLAMPHPDYGSGNISPKPATMAVAAMTRVLDGTVTLGPLNGLPAKVYGYAFQRTSGPVVTALWAYNPAYGASVSYNLTVAAPGSNGNVVVIDGMGNPATATYTDGKVALTLGDLPQYVVSTDLAAITAQVTTPEGYDPSL